MGKKSNKELRKANGYTFNTDDMIKKLRDEFMVSEEPVAEENVQTKRTNSRFSVVSRIGSNVKS